MMAMHSIDNWITENEHDTGGTKENHAKVEHVQALCERQTSRLQQVYWLLITQQVTLIADDGIEDRTMVKAKVETKAKVKVKPVYWDRYHCSSKL